MARTRHQLPLGTAAMPDDDDATNANDIDLSTLLDMDVVVYRKNDDIQCGAMQEDGRLERLSIWTHEPAFGNALECLVDDQDRFELDQDSITVLYQLTEDELSYGSRQCQRGVHNPHGEESEMLYYIDQSVLERYAVDLPLKPDLEMLW